MKIALINDQHLGVRNDSLQFHKLFRKFYKNVFFPYLNKNGISTVFTLGDLFDRRKYVNYNTLHLAKRYWLDPLRENNIDYHVLIGNHDVYYKSTNEINSPSMLVDGFNVYTEPQEVTLGNLKILVLPWICADNIEQTLDLIEKTDARIVFSHLELVGFEMYRGNVMTQGMSHKLFSKFDAVYSGHYHHKSSKDNIHYLGAPYEMTWADYDDPRGFHVFDTETLDLTFIPNPYTMFEKVFYSEETDIEQDYPNVKDKYIKIIVQEKNDPYRFDVFVDRISAANPAHLQVVEDNLNLQLEEDSDIISEAEDTYTLIKKYIGHLNLNNKDNIERLFYGLYHDALSIE